MSRITAWLASIVLILVVSSSVFISSEASAQDIFMKKHATAEVACKECHDKGAATTKPVAKDELARIGTKEFCLQCHGSYKKLTGQTANYEKPFNPHHSHYDGLDCNQCHHEHRASEMFCSSCHFDIKVPGGWKATKNAAIE
jgi:hypothetical protein